MGWPAPSQLTQPPRPGHGGRWPARVTISPQDDAERPGYSPRRHHSVHSPGPFTGKFMALRRHSRISSRSAWFLALLRRPAGRRARNLPATSAGDTVSRNNYRPSQLQPGRPGQGAQPPITAVFRLPQVPRHLRRKGLATNFTGFGAVRALKPDKTRIWGILKYRLRGRSTVMHRERHSGQPWRWIECSAGIGPHGAVAVIKVARRVLRSLSPSRWHWD